MWPKSGCGGIKGTVIGNSLRQEEKVTETPAPTAYNIPSDFVFRDPQNPNDKNGKMPKFAFGIKTVIKPNTLDVPGPGSYEVDVYPMN